MSYCCQTLSVPSVSSRLVIPLVISFCFGNCFFKKFFRFEAVCFHLIYLSKVDSIGKVGFAWVYRASGSKRRNKKLTWLNFDCQSSQYFQFLSFNTYYHLSLPLCQLCNKNSKKIEIKRGKNRKHLIEVSQENHFLTQSKSPQNLLNR